MPPKEDTANVVDGSVKKKKKQFYLFTGIGSIILLVLIIASIYYISHLFSLSSEETTNLPTYHAAQITTSALSTITPSIIDTVTITLSTAQNLGWQSYDSPDGHFLVSFPLLPTVKSSTVPVSGTANVTVNTYTSSPTSVNIYTVNDSLYPVAYKPDNSNATLTRMLNDSIQANSSLKLIASTFKTFIGFNAIEYTLLNSANNKQIYTKNILVPTKTSVYVLQVSAATNSFPNYDVFLNSFKSLD